MSAASSWLLESERLGTERPRLLPTLSNGVLGLTVAQPTIHRACLYTATGTAQFRARIPGYANYWIGAPSQCTCP